MSAANTTPGWRICGLAVVLVLPAILGSGCIFGCKTRERSAIWTQDNVPMPYSETAVDACFGEFCGAVFWMPDGVRLKVQVWADDPVSHAELVNFTEQLFASKNWPPPDLSDAVEETGCGDDW